MCERLMKLQAYGCTCKASVQRVLYALRSWILDPIFRGAERTSPFSPAPSWEQGSCVAVVYALFVGGGEPLSVQHQRTRAKLSCPTGWKVHCFLLKAHFSGFFLRNADTCTCKGISYT